MGRWHLKPEARKRLAEKYCLYMHGVLPLQRALHARGYRSGLVMAREGNGQVSGFVREGLLIGLALFWWSK